MCSAPSLHQKVMKLDETTQDREMEEGCEIMRQRTKSTHAANLKSRK